MIAPTTTARAAALVAGVLLLAGCTSSTPSDPAGTADASASTPSSSSTADAALAASTCVADPDAAIAAGKTAQPTGELPADLVSSLDAAAQAAFDLGASPGAIVGVQTPEGKWTKAYGLADPVAGTPMEVGMHTRIASLTKMYTGTILLQLAQEGKLSLDDTIDTYVDGIPNGDSITLTELANMTSGVNTYTANEAFITEYFADPTASFTPDELVTATVDVSPAAEPGERFLYSNGNTVILGEVIEEVTGRAFADELQERILDPLELTSTVWPGESAAMPEPFARGFTLNGDEAEATGAPTDSTDWNPSWAWTAGELISTTDDLLTMGRALGTGAGILDDATQKLRLESFLDPSQSPPAPGAGGYGLQMGCGQGWVGHAGELSGYNTTQFYDTATDTTVSVQTNSDVASGGCENSPTLQDDPGDEICAVSAVRIFVGLSGVLGETYQPPPRS
ncbi:beta-lactamase family protein [Herbiconiux sp. CPCC 203407]|uniref:Beta-lactamase family protein n=1 Tax=Herbiconiux oxytropis TaxID=2970915 RepID=A0AA42BWM0_9MICO|nr:serine hydrolase domain-containing protein [Herbiconiux oxytropis]MCS5723461.1 beta-lactamase family protein [Herbiconiux oxytropis]MCS5726548.1 beta-lactamase family protein [Herbiconiux oxytropis]